MKRSRILLVFACVTLCSAVLAWKAWPHFLLRSAEHRLNYLYELHRPFSYRWLGAPYGLAPSQTNQNDERLALLPSAQKLPQELSDKVESDIAKARKEVLKAEEFLGRTSKSSQLLGRIGLLIGAYNLQKLACTKTPECTSYNEAVAKYKLALLLQPSDPSLQLELGISYALRARAEGRALDYESALEWMLESSGNISTPECVFDSALLFEEVPLLHQARDSWKKAIATETSANWSKEALQRLIGLEKALQDRERRIHGLTDSPISYLAHAKEAQGSVELVIGEALANWLPLLHSSADHQRALEHLASQLKDQYNDPWLADLLQLPKSSTGERALRALSASWNANQKGE